MLMPRSIALRKHMQGRRGFLTGGVNLYFSQAAYDAYLADSRPTAADKALAGGAVKSAADLAVLGWTNAQSTANPPTLVTTKGGFLGYGASQYFNYSQSDPAPSAAGSSPPTLGTYTDPATGIVCETITFPAGAGGYATSRVTLSVNGTSLPAGDYVAWWEVYSDVAVPQTTVQGYVQGASSTSGNPYHTGTLVAGQWNTVVVGWTDSGSGGFNLTLYRNGDVLASPLTLKLRRRVMARVLSYAAYPTAVVNPTGALPGYVRTTNAAPAYGVPIAFDRGATTNLLTSPRTLGTQTVTVLSGVTYTLSAYGTGSVTLSGGGAGTLSPASTTMRGQLTFTTSSTSLTLTVSGSITNANLNPGYATTYLDTTGLAPPCYTAGTPRSQNLATGSGTQSITVVSGCVYSILHQAGGTYTLSGATTGTTTAGTTTTFVAASGTLTLTASSTPTLLQVWEGSASMAYVAGPYSEYPQRGIIDRGAATNVIKGSAAQWAARGTATKAGATDAQVGAYLQLRGLAAISANDVYQTATGLTVSAACQPGFWLRRITTTGQLNIADPTAGNGSWGIDLSKLPPYWVWINRNSPYITAVSAEFTANGSGANGLHFYRGSGASAIDVDIAIPTLISAANADAPDLGIPTTTAAVTRSACQIMLPSSYVADAGQMTVWGGSMVNPTDGNPEIVVGRTANGRVIYAAGQWARIYDGTTVTGAQSIGYGQQIIATRYGSGTQAACLNGGSVATGAYDGTMGSGSSVGLGHDGSGGAKFVGDHFCLKIGPPPANDATLQLASAGGV